MMGRIWPVGNAGRDGRAKALAALIFLLVVIVQGALHLPSAGAGRPYESWDEIATFNNAHVISGPAADQAFRYGPLDTFLQWAAIVHHDFFDPAGRMHDGARYSNSVPRSWNNPYLGFDMTTYTDGTWPRNLSYNYMRGVDDRNPIFVSRQLHFLVFYLILTGLGLTAIFTFGKQAIFFLAPLALLSTSPEAYFQATQSLPNGINCLLVFGIVTLALIYCDRQRIGFLLGSAGLLAIGLNFKVDMLVAAAAPGLAICMTLYRQGWRKALHDAVWAGLLGLAVLCATRPSLLIAPLMELRIQYHVVLDARKGGSPEAYRQNICILRDFLAGSILWPGTGLIASILVAAGLLAAAVGAWRKRASGGLPLLIGVAITLAAWASVIFRAPTADRYLINGLGAFLATMAMALFLLARNNARSLMAARILCAVILASWAGHTALASASSLAIARGAAAHESFDPAHTRTQIGMRALDLIRTGKFSNTVLVDQHSYIDLRLLRLHEVDAVYVNMDTLDSVIAGLKDGKDHLVIFAHGTSALSRHSTADKSLQDRYDAYLARFRKWPVLAHIPGARAFVFSIAPINPGDEMFIARLDRAAP